MVGQPVHLLNVPKSISSNLDSSWKLQKKNLYKSVQQAVLDAISAYRQLDATQKLLRLWKEAFAYGQQKYDLGLISSYDYLQAKNNLAKSKADFVAGEIRLYFQIENPGFLPGKTPDF